MYIYICIYILKYLHTYISTRCPPEGPDFIRKKTVYRKGVNPTTPSSDGATIPAKSAGILKTARDSKANDENESSDDEGGMEERKGSGEEEDEEEQHAKEELRASWGM